MICKPYILASAFLAGSLQAAVVMSYDSGVTATAGTTGASTPTSQGWTETALNNGFADGYDSGDGGWRTVDGTGSGPANYSQTISSSDQTAMATADGWQLTWTVSMDRDFVGSQGAFGADYYAAPNQSRQNNILVLVELASDDVAYNIQHDVSSSNQLFFSYGGNTYITDLLTSSDGAPDYGTFSLTHSNITNTAILDYGDGTATLTPTTGSTRNVVFFGAGNSAGQGSAIWNEVQLVTVPEPSSLVLLAIAIGVLGVVCKRSKR